MCEISLWSVRFGFVQQRADPSLHTPLDDLLLFLSLSLISIFSPFTFLPSIRRHRMSQFVLVNIQMSKGKQKEMRDVRKSWLVRAPALCSPLTLPLTLSMTLGSEVVWKHRRQGSLSVGWVMSGVLARTHGLFGSIRHVFLSMCWTLSRPHFQAACVPELFHNSVLALVYKSASGEFTPKG